MMTEYLTRKEAAEYLKVSVSLLEQLAWKKEGPVFYKISAKCTRYHLDGLNEWLETRKTNKIRNSKG